MELSLSTVSALTCLERPSQVSWSIPVKEKPENISLLKCGQKYESLEAAMLFALISGSLSIPLAFLSQRDLGPRVLVVTKRLVNLVLGEGVLL